MISTGLSGAPWIGLPQGNWPGIGLDLGPAFVELLPAFAFVAPHRRHPDNHRYGRHSARVVAPPPGRGLPGGRRRGGGGRHRQTAFRSRRDCADSDHRRQRPHGRADGGRGPQGGNRRRRRADRARLPAQGTCHDTGDTQPGRRRLSDRRAGVDLCPWDDGGGTGRDRSSQGADRRCCLLGRRRLPERSPLPRSSRGASWRPPGERHNCRGGSRQFS